LENIKDIFGNSLFININLSGSLIEIYDSVFEVKDYPSIDEEIILWNHNKFPTSIPFNNYDDLYHRNSSGDLILQI